MRARMRWLGPALVCAVLAPASAEAATLVNTGGRLTYTGQPGEQNVVEIAEVYGTIQVGPMRGTVSGCTARNQTVFGCSGVASIVAELGDGDDSVYVGSPRSHVQLYGGPGDDELVLVDAAAGSTIGGGPGIDTATVSSRSGLPVTVTLDGLANDGTPGAALDVADDVENVSGVSHGEPGSHGTVALTGNPGPNVLATGDGADTLTGGAGSDVLLGRGGDDTLDARDGERDRVECGKGSDTALVDAFDEVGDTCEQVLVSATEAPSAEDGPPRVAFTGGALDVDATDDRGIARVEFRLGDRLLCTDTARPYTCAFAPGVADVGRRTFVATAFDSAGQTATARQTLTVPRLAARSVTLSVKRQGKRFLASGRVTLPAGVACAGEVAVKVGATSRTAKLSRACTYRVTLPRGGRFVATYSGTTAIEAKRSPARTAR